MAKADGGLRREIQKHLAKPEWTWTVVESGGTHQGIPDSFWARRDGECGWVECKKTDGWSVEVRPHQKSWCRIHRERGIRTCFAIRGRGAGSSAGTGDSLWLVDGRRGDLLDEVGLRITPEGGLLGCWLGAPTHWDWDAIGRVLRTGERLS